MDLKRMLNLSSETLTEECFEDCLVQSQLSGLAIWWLKPELLKRFNYFYPHPRPNLPTGLGCCWILLVLSKENPDSIFRPGMILPLRWLKSKNHDYDNLPPGLVKLADMVKRQQKIGNDNWGLRFGFKQHPNMSSVLVEEDWWQSAWATLYAGLRLALKEEIPDPTVFATGAWKEGIHEVEGLEEKLQVATEFGAKHFCVPEQAKWKESFDQQRIGDVAIHYLTAGSKPDKVVSNYMALLQSEPPEDATPKKFDAYYINMPREKGLQNFYLKRCKSTVIENAKRYEDIIKNLRNGTLVSWVSAGDELIDVAVEVFQPKRVVLLYTIDKTPNKARTFKDVAESKRAKLEINNSRVFILLPFDENFSIGYLHNEICVKFRDTRLEEPLVIDLTPGMIPMSIALYNSMPENVTFLYWRKKMDKDQNRPIPSTTFPEIWRVCQGKIELLTPDQEPQ